MRFLVFIFRLLAIGPCVIFASCSAEAISEQRDNDSVGSELLLCKECPIFVRVPDALNTPRPIRYVSKYELTWNNYLAAYDDGACSIPNPNSGPVPFKNNDILPHLDKFRIDWPVGQLGPAEVKCYVQWLQQKTDFQVTLPTGDEWEWFARAGKKGAKFPWGNEVDPAKEALKGSSISRELELPLSYAQGGKYIHKYLTGVKVGMFPPNRWGIYDVMGNARELTADLISGKEHYKAQPDSDYARRTQNRDKVLVKGSNRYDPSWHKKGISDKRYVTIWDGRFTARVALRLILIK